MFILLLIIINVFVLSIIPLIFPRKPIMSISKDDLFGDPAPLGDLDSTQIHKINENHYYRFYPNGRGISVITQENSKYEVAILIGIYGNCKVDFTDPLKDDVYVYLDQSIVNIVNLSAKIIQLPAIQDLT